MKAIKLIIVEDSVEFSSALRTVLEGQKRFPCQVVELNPVRPELPTFEQFHDEIMAHANDFGAVVLMDNSLGKWKWTGAHLAPSFQDLVAISSEEMPWAKFNFTGKAMIAYHNKEDAKVLLVDTVWKAIERSMPPGFMDELAAQQQC